MRNGPKTRRSVRAAFVVGDGGGGSGGGGGGPVRGSRETTVPSWFRPPPRRRPPPPPPTILFGFVLLYAAASFSAMIAPRGGTRGGGDRDGTEAATTARGPHGKGGMSASDMTSLGYGARPRALAHYHYAEGSSGSFRGNADADAEGAGAGLDEIVRTDAFRTVPIRQEPYPTKRRAEWTSEDEAGRLALLNSVPYGEEEHRALRPYRKHPECVPMHDWQVRSFPACNDVHQVDLTDLSYRRNRWHRQVRVIAHGYFRDVWAVREYDGVTLRVLKTIRYEHDFDEWNYDRHRMDAIAYDQLTSSPHVLDIYGFCGNTALFEYAPGGDMTDAIFDDDPKARPSLEEKLLMAADAARGVRDLHTFNGRGAAAIVHADIMTNQFVLAGGAYKLSDFNRCTFLYWNSTSEDGNCPYRYGDYNAWIFRSPEEYYYDLQTEKIDVYSLGNVFYTLLMEDFPFQALYDKEGTSAVRKAVRAGQRPPLSEGLRESKNPRKVALVKAMDMCHIHDWRVRPSAKEVADFLDAELKRIELGEGKGATVKDGNAEEGVSG